MRFSLRNQNKISKALGADYLQLLLASLKEYFTKNEEIKEHTYQHLNNGNGHQVIHVPSVYPRSEIDFEFVIYARKFDVLNLAYYGSIG